jgi:hypothetical protein
MDRKRIQSAYDILGDNIDNYNKLIADINSNADSGEITNKQKVDNIRGIKILLEISKTMQDCVKYTLDTYPFEHVVVLTEDEVLK